MDGSFGPAGGLVDCWIFDCWIGGFWFPVPGSRFPVGEALGSRANRLVAAL